MAFCNVRLVLKRVTLDFHNLANVHDYSNVMGNRGNGVAQKVHPFTIVIAILDCRSYMDADTEHYVQVSSINPLIYSNVFDSLDYIYHDLDIIY